MMLVRDNKYIPERDKDFFILLRAGLWQMVEEPLSEKPDWEYIYETACIQGVVGLVANGVSVLGINDIVPLRYQTQLLTDSAQIVKRNLKMEEFHLWIGKFFAEHGISYVIIKGYCCAQAYQNPLLRESGDVDIYLPIGDYNKIYDLLAPISGHVVGDILGTHLTMVFDDIAVEFHHKSVFAYSKRLDDVLYLQGRRMFVNGNISKVKGLVCIPKANNQILLSVSNNLTRYCRQNARLRQLCDLACLLNSYQDSEGIIELYSCLKKARITKEWNWFLTFCYNYLGVTNKCFEFKNNKRAPFIWQMCKLYGDIKDTNTTLLKVGARKLRFIHRVANVHKELYKHFVFECKSSPNLAFFNMATTYRRLFDKGWNYMLRKTVS